MPCARDKRCIAAGHGGDGATNDRKRCCRAQQLKVVGLSLVAHPDVLDKSIPHSWQLKKSVRAELRQFLALGYPPQTRLHLLFAQGEGSIYAAQTACSEFPSFWQVALQLSERIISQLNTVGTTTDKSLSHAHIPWRQSFHF